MGGGGSIHASASTFVLERKARIQRFHLLSASKSIYTFIGPGCFVIQRQFDVIRLFDIITEANSVGSGFPVDPEGDPGQDDEHHARDVDLDDEIASVSPDVEVHLKYGILS